jgi:hypothetical protein
MAAPATSTRPLKWPGTYQCETLKLHQAGAVTREHSSIKEAVSAKVQCTSCKESNGEEGPQKERTLLTFIRKQNGAFERCSAVVLVVAAVVVIVVVASL